MRKVKDTIWLLKSGITALSIGMIIAAIYAEISVSQRDEAYMDANRLFNEAHALRDSLKWYQYQEKLRAWEVENNVNALVRALIIIETEGQSNPEQAVGDRGKAVGVLQLHPGVVEDLRVAGHNYSLEDRYDREKSIEMWLKWMEIWVPDKNIDRIIKKHNPRLSWAQHERIIRLMEIIRDEY